MRLPSPQDFIDHSLGQNSSHPKWLGIRSRTLWWIAFLPIGVLIIAYVIAMIALPSQMTSLSNLPNWVLVCSIASLAFVSFTLTASLQCALASQSAGYEKTKKRQHYIPSIIRNLGGHIWPGRTSDRHSGHHVMAIGETSHGDFGLFHVPIDFAESPGRFPKQPARVLIQGIQQNIWTALLSYWNSAYSRRSP